MQNAGLKDIRTFKLEELRALFEEMGEKTFRANQVFDWVWKKHCKDFQQMSNLPQSVRDWLQTRFAIHYLRNDDQQVSEDYTVKNAFKLFDGKVVEGVLIPTNTRMTACISSQVGCSLSCSFCATGKMARMRNLEPYEIYDQVVAIHKQALQKYGHPLTNIVYMGMGEPLMNYRGLMGSVEMITSEQGLNMSPKRITVSTAGIARMIKRLADDGVKFNLALSLHAATDEKRSKIMPINESNSLEALMEALQYFASKTRNRITFEYIIFKDFNDSESDAIKLAAYARKLNARVNIIEYNPVEGVEFNRADIAQVDFFASTLEKNGASVTIRRSRGMDIDAACGQLANKNKAVAEV